MGLAAAEAATGDRVCVEATSPCGSVGLGYSKPTWDLGWDPPTCGNES